MVRQAIVDMFLALLTMRGGEQAGALFLEHLRLLAADGLGVDNNALYDDPTPRDAGRAGSNIPKSVAAAGLGLTVSYFFLIRLSSASYVALMLDWV